MAEDEGYAQQKRKANAQNIWEGQCSKGNKQNIKSLRKDNKK